MRGFTPRLGVLLGAALLVTAACGRGKNGPGALVLIVIDTLRADHLGAYGSSEASTPVLDALAARGTRFAQAMTPAPITLPAVSSLLTGRLPFHHGVRDNDRYTLPETELTLAERFRGAGWRTQAVVASAILASDRGLSQGFETYEDKFAPPFPIHTPTLEVFADELARSQRRADAVTDLALAGLAGLGDEPFFLFVHYFDVHSYYDPPPPYREKHRNNLYDGEVSFVDAEIGRLLEGLAKRPDALIVVVSDHGEGLGEHGETSTVLLHQSTVQVAFLAAGPGVPVGLVRTDPVSLVDVEPTLAAIFRLRGQSPETAVCCGGTSRNRPRLRSTRRPAAPSSPTDGASCARSAGNAGSSSRDRATSSTTWRRIRPNGPRKQTRRVPPRCGRSWRP
jgi:arylsulfatase A-like enzyme